MFNNIDCEIFKQDLNNLINNSGLLPVVAYYILKDSLHDLEKICQEVIIHERQNFKEQQKQVEIEIPENKKNQQILNQAIQINNIINQDQSQD